jgi:hypothetical protein
VAEDRDISVSLRAVNNILSVITGHHVDVGDMLRISRFIANGDASPAGLALSWLNCASFEIGALFSVDAANFCNIASVVDSLCLMSPSR